MVRFRCIRSNGNARKRHETGNGNTGYPSCFQNGLICFCHVSVYGFLQFRPVKVLKMNESYFSKLFISQLIHTFPCTSRTREYLAITKGILDFPVQLLSLKLPDWDIWNEYSTYPSVFDLSIFSSVILNLLARSSRK